MPMSFDPKRNGKGRPIYLSADSNCIIGYEIGTKEENVGEIDRKRIDKHKKFTCQREVVYETLPLLVQQQAADGVAKRESCSAATMRKVITVKQYFDMEKAKTRHVPNKREQDNTIEEKRVRKSEFVESIERSDNVQDQEQSAPTNAENGRARQDETPQVSDINCEQTTEVGPSHAVIDHTKVNKMPNPEDDFDCDDFVSKKISTDRTGYKDTATMKKVVKNEPMLLDKDAKLEESEFPFLESSVETITETIFHFEEESDIPEFSRELACSKVSPGSMREILNDPESPKLIGVIKREDSTFTVDDDESIPSFNWAIAVQPHFQDFRATPQASGSEKYSRRAKLSPKKLTYTKGTLCNMCGEFDTSRKELHSFVYVIKGDNGNRYKRFLCLTCNIRFAAAELDQHKKECYLTSIDDIGYDTKTKKFRMMACESCVETRKFL